MTMHVDSAKVRVPFESLLTIAFCAAASALIEPTNVSAAFVFVCLTCAFRQVRARLAARAGEVGQDCGRISLRILQLFTCCVILAGEIRRARFAELVGL